MTRLTENDRHKGSTTATSRVRRFYQTTGYALVDEGNYPDCIRRYLGEQEHLVERVLEHGRYNSVLEVGCMDGRLLLLPVLDSGRNYWGIDLVEAAILAAESLIGAQHLQPQQIASVAVGDVSRLGNVLFPLPLPGRGSHTIAIFPFNAFGNLAEPPASVAAIGEVGFDLLVLSYATTEEANRQRHEYYSRCGYKNIVQVDDDLGVLFYTATDLLHTYAYHPDALAAMLEAYQFQVRESVTFANGLGWACWATRPDSAPPPYSQKGNEL